jgi:hypothetical protein
MENFDKSLNDWLVRAEKIIEDYFVKMKFTNIQPEKLSIDPRGIKYIRIIRTGDRGYQSVHCFIEKATGNVLMASTWDKPALNGPRGNIFEIGKEGVGPHGALYKGQQI